MNDNEKAPHMTHCYQGRDPDGCKYGEDDCPMKESFNFTNLVWKKKLRECSRTFDHIVRPRGMEVKEVIGSSYRVPLPAYIDLKSRNTNYSFMFGEAWWIVSGSNRLSDIRHYMESYKNFSDDQQFLRGAYGPKVVDQLPYVVDALIADHDSRQAVMTIWRERPGAGKDIPCTVAAQFFIRDNRLSMIATMRSNDVVLGFTYDVFTFSMIAKAVQLLINERGDYKVGLGFLQVNPGSLHLYETHYEKVDKWLTDEEISPIRDVVDGISTAKTYEELIWKLREAADADR